MTWGSGWGDTPWGGGGDELRLLEALAVRENTIRLTFSAPTDAAPPLFTGILDVHDASNPARYIVTPVAGTIGSDGLPPRPVTVVAAKQVAAAGSEIDITLDRLMSPYPAEYRIAVNGLITTDGQLLASTGVTSVLFNGVHRAVQPPAMDTAIPSRDIANPQNAASLVGLPGGASTVLGTFSIDDSGDYAFDQGITNLKKRIFRRLTTGKGRFGHLPEYGVGVPGRMKRLNSASVRQIAVADAEHQILQEPDVRRVSVRIVSDPSAPNIIRFKIRVTAKFSQTPIDVDIPFTQGQ